MALIDSGRIAVLGDQSAADGNFFPFTGPVDTTGIRIVRPTWWNDQNAANLTTRPAIRFSDDGFNWGSPVVLAGSAASATQGYNFGVDTDLFGGTYSPKLFAQFGMFARNTSGATVVPGQTRLIIDGQTFPNDTIVETISVTADTNTTVARFTPLTDMVPGDDIEEIRASLDVLATTTTTNLTLQAGWQTTDTPWDGASWGTATAFGPIWSGVGGVLQVFGTTFATRGAAVSRFVRFGVFATHVAAPGAGQCDVATVTLRVDWRNT